MDVKDQETVCRYRKDLESNPAVFQVQWLGERGARGLKSSKVEVES